MKRLLYIINLTAGTNQIRPHLGEIVDVFVAAGYEVVVHTTQSEKDAYNVVRKRASDYDLVVCSGGDGTLDEIASGMLDLREAPPLGYIPAGTTNDFAKSLGISTDMMTAARDVLTGKSYMCDMGVFNTRYYCYVAAFGLFSDVSYQTSQEIKNAIGHLAYVLEGIKSLASVKSYAMTVEFNDQIIQGDFVYGMVSNSISVGGFKSIGGKEMELDDGLFELLLVRMPKNLLEIPAIIGALLQQKPYEKYVIAAKVSSVHLKSEEDVAWTLDGEDGGSWREVDIYNIQQSLEIIRPNQVAASQRLVEDGTVEE